MLGFWGLVSGLRYSVWLRNPASVDGKHPIIYRVSTIQGGVGFLPSTVCWDILGLMIPKNEQIFLRGLKPPRKQSKGWFFPNLIVGPVQKAFVHCGMNLLVSMWMNQSMEFSTVLTSNIFDTHHETWFFRELGLTSWSVWLVWQVIQYYPLVI